MSAWRLFVAHAVEAGKPVKARGQHRNDVATALRLGLIERVSHGFYIATDAGRLFAQGRVTTIPRPSLTGYRGRPETMLAATWLRALPQGLRMDMRPPRAAVSEWGGLVNILAIDPGPVRSGVVSFIDGRIAWADPAMLNGAVLLHVEQAPANVRVACEVMQASYAPTIGADVIETIKWVGEFRHARRPLPLLELSRQRIKAVLCNGNVKANDAGVRQALIDRLGPPGSKKAPGPTYGVTSHAWAALAVAVAAAHEISARVAEAA